MQHVEFDVQLLGNCDDVVVELTRRAGWGLKHDMVDPKVVMKVEGTEDAEHMWQVRKEDRVVANGSSVERAAVEHRDGAGGSAVKGTGHRDEAVSDVT